MKRRDVLKIISLVPVPAVAGPLLVKISVQPLTIADLELEVKRMFGGRVYDMQPKAYEEFTDLRDLETIRLVPIVWRDHGHNQLALLSNAWSHMVEISSAWPGAALYWRVRPKFEPFAPFGAETPETQLRMRYAIMPREWVARVHA